MAKKIAFLNVYQGRVGRGAETFINELSVRLQNDFSVEVIAGNKPAFPRWPFFWRLFLDPTGLNILFFTLKSLPQIWKEKYDVVIPSNGGWQTFLVRIATLLYGGKMVVSGQSGIGWDDRVNLWLFPDYFVGISSKAVSWAKKVNPFVKSVYIPNGVDLIKFKPTGLSYNYNLKKPIVLCVGALTKSKNIETVIKAVEKLDGASLVIAGDGYLRDEIRYLGRQKLHDRFDLQMFSYDSMPEVYRGADVFTLVSSDREAFGIVYVEAMASGLPVVARNDEQRREIVGDAGVLIDNPEDTQEFTAALKKVLTTKWGDKPRKQAEKFDWDNIVEKYKEILL